MVQKSELSFIQKLIQKEDAPWTIEIGGGLGFLTELIIEKKNLTVFEIDEKLNMILRQRFGPELIKKDIRSWDPRSCSSSGSLVGNLPYYLSGRILWTVARWPEKIHNVVFTVQKEVAERICATPGNKAFGVISGPLQCFYSCRIKKILPPGCFFPRPQVESAVLTLKNRGGKDNFQHAENYLKINKIIFGQRRKKVKKLLKNIVSENAIKEIPEGFRAEDLNPDFGLFLAKNIKN